MRILFGLMIGLVLQTVPAGGPRVVNISYPGNNSAELDAKFGEALRVARPTYVVLMAGANDALNDKKFLPIEQTRTHLQSMVERAKATGARVVLVQTHDPDVRRLLQRHRLEDYGGSPPLVRLRMANGMIAKLGAELGATVVDFNAVLAARGGADAELSTDGVHLTAKGYGLLAAAVRSGMPAQLSAEDTVLCFGDSLTYGTGVRDANAAETPLTYPAQLRALLKK